MFDPKQALNRIRRAKNQKEQSNSISQGVQPLFQSPNFEEPKVDTDMNSRITNLELMVMRLSQQLQNSNEAVSKLKRQNSSLQTQVLKLEYENSQFKSSQIYSDIRKNAPSKTYNSSIDESAQKQQSQKKLLKNQSHLVSIIEPQKLSVEVEQIIEDIKSQPIENVLRRKQYQYKARKPDAKQFALANKYLKQLAAIQKDYSKTMKRPTLVIKLDNADFQ